MIDWIQGIDERAIIHPRAKLGSNVTVGAYSVIGPDVTIGDDTWIGPHVALDGHTTIGARNKVYPFSSIGLPPQDLKYDGSPTQVVIGDGNTFREHCSIHRGTPGGGAITRIGNECYLMAGSHIAHDCLVGDKVTFANMGSLAGHVVVEDRVTISAFSGVHQFCRIGRAAFIGAYSVITRDALPYCLTVGNRAHCYGINAIGLRRAGFQEETIRALDRAVRGIFDQGSTRASAIEDVEAREGHVPEVKEVIAFIRASKRGVIPIRIGATP